jgi:ABC-type sulfate transport system substrate-binding protein
VNLHRSRITSLEYPVVDLAVVKDYGGWTEIQQKFFADEIMFDRLRNGS